MSAETRAGISHATPHHWTCKPCRFAVEYSPTYMEAVRAHLRTKKHQRLKNACPRCSSLRMQPIKGEHWDRDEMRDALKCARCWTEYKCYAHGIQEKSADEYTGNKPPRIVAAEEAAFEKLARSRGYVKLENIKITDIKHIPELAFGDTVIVTYPIEANSAGFRGNCIASANVRPCCKWMGTPNCDCTVKGVAP